MHTEPPLDRSLRVRALGSNKGRVRYGRKCASAQALPSRSASPWDVALVSYYARAARISHRCVTPAPSCTQGRGAAPQ
jgi:hypothetical protein